MAREVSSSAARAEGSAVFRKKVSRERFLAKVSGRGPCTVAMEAVCEVASRPGMRFVAVKTAESGGPSSYDAGKKFKGRKRHLVVEVEGFPIKIAIREASVQDQDGAPTMILSMLEAATHVKKLWANGGCQGLKLAATPRELGL